MLNEDRALRCLVRLARMDHPAIRYAAVHGMLMLLPDSEGAMRAALGTLEQDPNPKVRLAAQLVRDRLRLDDDDPITLVDSPAAKRVSMAPGE